MNAIWDDGLNVFQPASCSLHVLGPQGNSICSSRLHHGIQSCMCVLGWNSEIHVLGNRGSRI